VILGVQNALCARSLSFWKQQRILRRLANSRRNSYATVP